MFLEREPSQALGFQSSGNNTHPTGSVNALDETFRIHATTLRLARWTTKLRPPVARRSPARGGDTPLATIRCAPVCCSRIQSGSCRTGVPENAMSRKASRTLPLMVNAVKPPILEPLPGRQVPILVRRAHASGDTPLAQRLLLSLPCTVLRF
jgi:hypothetical protein